MRICGAMAAAIILLFIPLTPKSQPWEEDSDFDIFYGERSFQEISLGVSPWLSPASGLGGQASFVYNTLSKNSVDALHWMNYYGVSVDLGNWSLDEYDFNKYGTRDASLYAGSIFIESRLFYEDQKKARPYIGIQGGLGIGGISLSDSDDDDDDDLSDSRLDFYQLGIEAGVHFMLNDRYGIVISDTTSYGYGVIQGDNLQVIQTCISVGISRWGSKSGKDEW